MAWFQWLWGLAGWPYAFIVRNMGIPLPPIVDLVLRILVLALVAYIAVRIVAYVWTELRGLLQGRKLDPVARPRPVSDDPHAPAVDLGAAAVAATAEGRAVPADEFEMTLNRLKRAKDYNGMAEVYAGAARYKDAAKWYKKGGNRRQSAVMLGKTGKPLKAARLLMREGDFVSAASYFLEANRALDAARAYEKGGRSGKAAASYLDAKRYEDAVKAFIDYFQHSAEDAESQVDAAEQALRLLRDPDAAKRISAESRKALLPEVAKRFEMVQRYDIAAQLHEESGDLARAGEVYLMGGHLQKAAQCMKTAGRDREAAQIHGRYYASQGSWRDAALSYAAAGEYLLAGDCYRKAKEALRAAECYEKADAAYHAGVSYAHAGKFDDAIRMLQRIKEDDANFDVSRGMLGRCFFEKKQYYDCVAALENYLTGQRVESGNKDYYYMLALAYEQTSKFPESRDILRKINSVDTTYRDVAERIATLSSQISLLSGATTGVLTTAVDREAGAAQHVSEQVGTRYRLEKELGRGGMGVVFRAHDTQLDRPVALKFIGELVDSSEEFRQRFIREAQAAAKINHPNVISVYDINATQGKAYIAMEFVDGGSLAGLYASEKVFPPKRAINLVGQATAALAAIHEAGIVHRDIKPDNIMIAKGGTVKLTDFGLARSADNRITRTGTAMGTPAYMSPEQVLGKEADARSDIYSMGLVLHQLLTGKIHFIEGDVLERQLKEMPPAPSTQIEGIPPELDAIVLRCLAKNPEERFASAREFLGQLQAVLTKLA